MRMRNGGDKNRVTKQMTTLISLDPNMPIPDSLTLEDASHPANIVRNSREIQNQAAEDARYDLKVPDRFRGTGRKEGFATIGLNRDNILLAIGLCIFIAVMAIAVRGRLGNLYILVVTLGFAALFVASGATSG